MTLYIISFLEDSQGDQENDDEQLLSMIRILEAEIHPNRYDLLVEAQLGGITEDFLLERQGQVKVQDCLVGLDVEFEWMDREISSHQPSDHMKARYMEHYGVEMVGVVEFGGVRDHSSLVAWHVSLESVYGKKLTTKCCRFFFKVFEKRKSLL